MATVIKAFTLLAAAAARAGITENANALPLGRSLYGYWATLFYRFPKRPGC